jgi:RNA polymerase sigma-70 factor (ECF subfamily)
MNFDQIAAEYGNNIMRLAYFYLKDRSLAEDITQDVLLKAYRNRETLPEGEQLGYWLMRVTANACKDQLRSWSRHRVQFMDEQFWGGLSASPEEGPEEHVAEQEEEKALLKAIMNLPIKYREVITLRYYQEMSGAEMSKVLGLNEVTIRTRLMRARDMLKRQLEKEWGQQ